MCLRRTRVDPSAIERHKRDIFLLRASVDQSVKEDTSWSYQLSGWLPWNWTYSATLADGTPLPSWITFSPATRTFSGTPPQDQNGSIAIAVYAREGTRLVGSDTFTLTITPLNDAPTVRRILLIRLSRKTPSGRSRFQPAHSQMWTTAA